MIDPGTWYPLDALFESSSIRQRDRTMHQIATRPLGDSPLVLQVHRLHKGPEVSVSSVQFELHRVPPTQGLDDLLTADTSRRLLREQVVYLPEAKSGWHMHLRSTFGEWTSPGRLIANLVLESRPAPGRNIAAQEEVSHAYQRGLLDQTGLDRASFRLGMRAMREQLETLLISGFVPHEAVRLDVVFCHWEDSSAAWHSHLPPGTNVHDIEIRFTQAPVHRGIRVSDLFATRH